MYSSITRRNTIKGLTASLASICTHSRGLAQAAPIRRIGVAYSVGGKGDRSYNDAAAEGTKKLRSRGFDVHEFEPAGLDALERGLQTLSRRGAGLIICVGFFYDNVIQRVARQNSSKSFVVLDGSVSPGPNVTAIKFNTYEGSFLGGAAAAAQTASGRIGFIGGMNVPIINEFRDGFVAGAKFTKPEIEPQIAYVGAGSEAFGDPARAYQVATALIAKGVDVLFHAAGASGNGVIKAVSEHRLTAIGVDVDQSHIAPDAVLTSVLKKFDEMMMLFVDRYIARTLVGGAETFGLRDDAVGLAKIAGIAASAVEPAVQAARSHILGK